ncbi:MAG: UDP-N-acetylmuramoyl-L-alanyl-D-glutamate--2,6-diaminopimelate ligase [Acidimicrobiia bacterium]
MPATLAEIVAAVDGAAFGGDGSVVAIDATHDSSEVSNGAVFVAIRGSRFDGHRYLAAAAAAGATAAVVEETQLSDLPQIVVADSRAAMAPVAREIHGRPDEDLSILGVTGTNGKTTVAHLCEAVWRHIGRSHGVIGTLGAQIDGDVYSLARTTPESSDLQRLLGIMRDRGVTSVAMEVSSHALELHRADAISFTAAGFTNLTQDHLDFHGDMESYFASKTEMFSENRTGLAVINTDDPWGARLKEMVSVQVVTVGLDPSADISASHVSLTNAGTSFRMTTLDEEVSVVLPLVGRFNVSNALVAAGLLLADGIDLNDIAAGLSTIDGVRGRMEIVPHSGDFTVIVDYAHTPDAVSAALAAVRDIAQGSVVALVGAGGDRDADKRELMGASASRLADYTIVTTDNPRSEDPDRIATDVRAGADLNPRGEVATILDRKAAITHAIEMAQPGDIVMVLGKGHEQGQEIDGVVLPFDDVDVAGEALRRRLA